jgi:hypothetical protein
MEAAGAGGTRPPYVCLWRDYLKELATPIDCAATSYQGLDLNEIFLIRFFGGNLDFFLGRTTKRF